MAKKTSKKAQKARKRRARRAFIICLLLFVFLAAAMRFIVFIPVHISSDGMIPRYRKGDIVYADKLDMWRHYSVERGKVVYAEPSAVQGGVIRTVAGMPGDLIDVRDGERVLVQRSESGETQNEIVLGPAPALVYGEIPSGAYLLLCDNLYAENAADSRTFGLVSETQLLATPKRVLWPISRLFGGN